MKRVMALMFLASLVYADPCNVSNVLSQIRPGEQWFIRNNDPATLVWMSPTTPPTLSEINAGVANCPNAINIGQRSEALNDVLSSQEGRDKFIRAFGLVLMDENNLQHEWDMNLKAVVAASTSLADYKTRVAAMPDMPDRTVQQALTAVVNKINSGASD